MLIPTILSRLDRCKASTDVVGVKSLNFGHSDLTVNTVSVTCLLVVLLLLALLLYNEHNQVCWFALTANLSIIHQCCLGIFLSVVLNLFGSVTASVLS